MNAVLVPVLTFLVVATAQHAVALESIFRLDESSVVYEFAGEKERTYDFDSSASFELVIGELDGDTYPVSVSRDGLRLGSLTAADERSLQVSMSEAGSGTLRLLEGGGATLSFDLPLLVRRYGSSRGVHLLLRFSAPISVDHLGRGRAELVAADDVVADGVNAGSFYSVISGFLDPVPEGLRRSLTSSSAATRTSPKQASGK